ncbi:hypothetical protein JCM10450v2_001037 [Rhodotorula kratochvilovae]
MAALNWAMLTPQGHPVPLPGEKFLWSSSPSIAISLFPHPPGSPLNVQPAKDSEYKATGGTLHVSQKRVVYVAPGAPSASAAGGGAVGTSAQGRSANAGDGGSLASGQASIAPGSGPRQRPPLHTLSVPIRFFVDGRFVQPWFTTAYYEALCLEGDGSGGLDTPHLVRLYFKESGGFDFYTAVEEVKARAEMADGRRGTPVEQLPAYEAPPSAHCTPLAQPTAAAPPSSSLAPPPHPPRTAPSPADLAAARVATDAEESEYAALEQRCQAEGAPPPDEADRAREEGERGAPPGYFDA